MGGEPNLFMGAVAENYVAQTLAVKCYLSWSGQAQCIFSRSWLVFL